MPRRVLPTLLILACALAILSSLVFLDRREPAQVQARLVAAPAAVEGFARADGPRPFSFPADHGPHPDFQTEWWYYTGNLQSGDGRHFGYQLTFFRRALLPSTAQPQRSSRWATRQVYLAHFALTDVSARTFNAFERLSRAAAGLAGAESPPYRVWLEDWSVEQVREDRYRLRAAQDGIEIDLDLFDAKGPVLQGENGFSKKGSQPGNASYYISQTRLETQGAITIAGSTYAVHGLSWMDHEFSTSALEPGQVGWDWFAVQLDDGSELMVFQIRRDDSRIDSHSSGSLISPDGSVRHLAQSDFEILVQDTWTSPASHAVYPSRWTLRVPSMDLVLEIEPHLAGQELNVSYIYWEGAVKVRGQRAGRPVSGNGYVELTGYAGSMEGQF